MSADHSQDVSELVDALERLVNCIESAGGPSRLRHAVQLGQISWMVKAENAMEQAKHVISKHEAQS